LIDEIFIKEITISDHPWNYSISNWQSGKSQIKEFFQCSL